MNFDFKEICLLGCRSDSPYFPTFATPPYPFLHVRVLPFFLLVVVIFSNGRNEVNSGSRWTRLRLWKAAVCRKF